MPGKHAPESPKSFYLSVARAAAGAAVALGVIIAIALIAVGSNGSKPEAKRSTAPSTPATSTARSTPSPTPTSKPSASPIPTLPPHAKVTVNVLNGTDRNGLAAKVATGLGKQGYDVQSVTNSKAHATATTIYYRPGAKFVAARLLREHPEFGKIAPALSSTPRNALLSLVLGDDYPTR